MNTTPLDPRPEVAAFVAAVRARFADLDDDEREELLDGLEADLADLVAERGPGVLGEPAAYAAELRAAAGLPPAGRARRPAAERVEGWLDGSRHRWDSVVTGLPGDPWGLLVALRPVWWVVRAWVALQVVDLVLGSGARNWGLSPVPSLLGWGLPLLVAAVLVSVQIGRGRLWPGTSGRGATARVLLLVLNTTAIALVPVTVSEVLTPARAASWFADDWGVGTGVDPDVITFQGRQVCTLRVVDGRGRRVPGARVLDGTSGRALPLDNESC